MRLRYYTPDDYVNGTPCLYKYRDVVETVFPISMSGVHVFDGGRALTIQSSNGYTRTTNIGEVNLLKYYMLQYEITVTQ